MEEYATTTEEVDSSNSQLTESEETQEGAEPDIKTSVVDEKSEEVDVSAQINEAIKIKNQTGQWPELDPILLYAAQAEKSRRDTQASYTKSRQELKALEQKKKVLESKLAELSLETVKLSKEEQEELDELKFDDPEAWYKKMRELELKQRAKLKNELEVVEKETEIESELERRKEILKEFSERHPEITLTDELIESNVPVRYLKDLEEGRVSFEDFLETAYRFITKNKKMVRKEVEKKPDLSKVRGGATPSDTQKGEDIILSYKDEIY